MLTTDDAETQGAPVALHIESGPSPHAPIPLKAGAKIQVGRASRAAVTLPHDSFLSGVHFEVEFDGQRCTLRDLRSSNGTVLRNVRIVEAPLAPGDRFIAGQTVFALLQSKPERRKSSGPVEVAPLENPAKQHLLKEFRTTCQPLYAVVDAAQDPRVLGFLMQAKAEYVLLFDQQTAPELFPFSPYLVFLAPESSMLETLLDLGWSQPWGVFLAGATTGTELLQRLRSLLVTQLPDGRECLLRYYDPRVLHTLLANATEPQASLLFSDVRWYLLAGQVPQSAVIFTRGARGAERTEVFLNDEAVVNAAFQKLTAQTGPAAAVRVDSGPAARIHLTETQVSELNEQTQDPAVQAIFKKMQKTHPDPFAARGDAAMFELVRHGCERSARYGIRGVQDVTSYIVMMLNLGRDFDQDPAFPWARDILTRRLPPDRKLELLQEAGEAAQTR